MTDPRLRPATAEDHPALVRVWRSAVDATHDFVAPGYLDAIEAKMLSDYLPVVELTAAELDDGPVGFAGLVDGRLEMLFVHDDHRGTGVGSALLADAVARHPGLTLDVNEQNEGAVAFYLARGFTVTGRSETDDAGQPYPILHLAREDSRG